jgi:hypothetical protein
MPNKTIGRLKAELYRAGWKLDRQRDTSHTESG